MISSLDAAREAHPALGFGLYAMEPGGAVALEVFTPEGLLYRFDGPTEADVFASAFPPLPVDNDEHPEPTTDIFS